MRKLLIVIAIISLAAGAALAKAPVKPVVPYDANGRAAEVEPNDSFADANTLTPGDDMSAAIDVAEDFDYFAVTLSAGDFVTFETHPGDAGDTQLTLYGPAPDYDNLVFDDDGGDGFYSLIANYEVPADGTYYVVVNHWSASGTGTYVLTATLEEPPPPPPANDVCAGAIDLQVQGLASFEVDLAAGGFSNQEPMGSGGCTGFNTNGPEAFYSIYLDAGETFTVTEDGDCDMALYLFTDCGDPFASCVDGSDNCCSGAQELISYEATADGWYYLGVDAYTSAGCLVTVTVDVPVANDDATWGAVKALYR